MQLKSSVTCIFATILLCLTGYAAGAEDAWSVLENSGAIVSHIEITVLPVFNLNNPEENHFIGRWANFIHINSRKESIRPALLFKEGEPANLVQIRASERLLRDLPFIRDAEIIPAENADGTVTAVVKIHDAWSLKLSMGLRHVGGESEWSAMIREYNILGLGKQVKVGYAKTLDRTLTDFAYQDPFLLNSRWILFSEYKQLSDGKAFAGMLHHPFYDVQTPWAAGVALNTSTSIQTLYERSEPVYNLDYTYHSFSLFYHFLVWQHHRSAQRLGLEGRINGYRYRGLTLFQPGVLPEFENQQRWFQGVLGFWQFFQDDYITRKNINYMQRVEDFNLGWDAQIRLGYFPKSLGSTLNAFYSEGSLEKGVALSEKNFISGKFSWRSLSEQPGPDRLWTQSDVNLFDQHFPRQTLVVSFQFVHSLQPLPADITYLGGSDGLRGYKNYFRAGDQRWMLTIEDRIFTPWDILGLVELGFVSYLDVGAVRELSSGRWGRHYASIGAGLRIGNLKSSFGRIFTLSVATPLVREPGMTGIQFVLGAGT